MVSSILRSTAESEAQPLRSVTRGARAVPLNQARVPADFVGIPWGTIVVLKAGHDQLPVAVGPAAYRLGRWVLPRFTGEDTEPARDIRVLRRQTVKLRRDLGTRLSMPWSIMSLHSMRPEIE